MRVLLQSRVTLFSGPGGDTVQVCKTADALRKLGVTCQISTELKPDLSEWDIVHLFNLTRPQEVYLQARNAVRQRKPIALSTIYLSGTDFDRAARGGSIGLLSKMLPPDAFEYLKVLARGVLNREWHGGTLALLRHGYHNLLHQVLQMSSILLPNSQSELERVLRDFPALSRNRFVVVPNAVDESLAPLHGANGSGGAAEHRNTVLCVANIGPRKNQLRLVRALNGSNIPLVIVGQPTPNAQGYFAQLKREAGPNVQILGRISDEEVRQCYREAKVHVLASWMETTGLSSLEAGLAGCNLVITDKGDTREYFGDMAFYCDPGSEDSIRKAVLEAYAAPAPTILQERIQKNFTWRKAAEATLDAYLRILPEKSAAAPPHQYLAYQ
jgi:glycosyltransferase involved in cell wall biosynthesis